MDKLVNRAGKEIEFYLLFLSGKEKFCHYKEKVNQ